MSTAMATLTDLQIYFCEKDKTVSFCYAKNPLMTTEYGVKNLLSDMCRRGPLRVKFYGIRSQALHILAASEFMYRDKVGAGVVCVGSPRDLRKTKHTTPELALSTMSLNRSGYHARGGWREMSVNDWRQFTFLSNPCEETFYDHPALPVVTALAPTSVGEGNKKPDTTDAINLLLWLEDPRWFQDAAVNSQSYGSLSMFLGVSKKNITNYSNFCVGTHELPKTGYGLNRFLTLMQLSFGQRALSENGSRRAKESPLACSWMTSTDSLAGSLFGTYYCPKSARQSGAAGECHSALFLTCMFLVRMLHEYWLHEVAPAGCEIFVLKYFLEEAKLRPKTFDKRLAAMTKLREKLPPKAGHQSLLDSKVWSRPVT